MPSRMSGAAECSLAAPTQIRWRHMSEAEHCFDRCRPGQRGARLLITVSEGLIPPIAALIVADH